MSGKYKEDAEMTYSKIVEMSKIPAKYFGRVEVAEDLEKQYDEFIKRLRGK